MAGLFLVHITNGASSDYIFAREKISLFCAFELLLFLFVILVYLSFFGTIKRLEGASPVADLSVPLKRLLACNVISLFAAHAALLLMAYTALSWPLSYPRLFVFFYKVVPSFHSQDYGIVPVKLGFIMIVILALFCQITYLARGKITLQNYCLLALLAWLGLFVMGVSNLFYALLLLDCASLVTASLIALCAWRGAGRAISFAIHYYILSALTSVGGYGGCVLVYSVYKTFDCNIIIYLSQEAIAPRLIDSPAFVIGIFLILIKVIFLLGLFPFQHYVVEVCRAANYGLLGFFLVVTKYPVLIFSVVLFKLM